MSENQSRKAEIMSKYDEMSTEELEEILRLDMEAPEEQESDTETLLYIMGVLAKRNRENGRIPNTAQESFESFKRKYLDVDPDEEDEPAPKKALRPCWVRALSTVAAVLVVVFLLGTTVHAFAPDFWQAVVTWTKETFSFGSNNKPGKNGDLPYKSLQEALDVAKIETPLAPSWIPEGYVLTDITVDSTPKQATYRAIYHRGEIALRISVSNHRESTPQHIEQSADLAEIYEVGGVKYYLFSNHERVRAAWLNDSYECSILGELTIEELKLMIDSIEKG